MVQGVGRTNRVAGRSAAECGPDNTAVVSHPGETTEDRATQGDEYRDHDGDESVGGEVSLTHWDAGEAVQGREDVESSAGNHPNNDQHACDYYPAKPHRDSLPNSVEECHPAGDIPAKVVRDQQDQGEHDSAHRRDCAGVVGGSVRNRARLSITAQTDRGEYRGEYRGDDDNGCGGCEPAEERQPEFQSPSPAATCDAAVPRKELSCFFGASCDRGWDRTIR
jgi:hypothetical protein